MKSIKTKIGVLVLLCVVLVAVTIGVTSIQSSKKIIEVNSTELMELEGKNKSGTIDALLSRIEQSVTTLADYTLSELDDLSKFKTDKEYVREFTDKLYGMAVNAGGNTEGALTVYIRYNPEFTEPTSGIFCSRESADSDFQKLVPTDFSMYDPSDVEHVGWYYIPVNNGKPTWTSPYMNENIGVEMISFVIPLTVQGTSVGIVGMDIDFSVIKDIINNTKVYETGYAFLTDESGNVIYRPDSAPEASKGWALVQSGLKNGMQIMLTAPSKEIHAEADILTSKILIISIIGVIIALIVSTLIVKGIIKPIKELNVAAGRIADGELDVTIAGRSRDEVGTLAKSFGMTAERLKTYLGYINEASDVLFQLSQGDLTIELNQEYVGEFIRIKEALINISDTLNTDFSSIKSASGEVAQGAEQVASGEQIISLGVAEQTEAIEELSQLTQGLVQIAETNSNGAKTVQELASKAGTDLRYNGEQMKKMVQAMEVISRNGDEIINKTQTLNDIASQTNILALNASIEAARAGEAGKGFAIVAEQVKNLAVKSTEIAKNISDLMANAVDSISNGTSIANETAVSVLETVEDTKSMEEIVAQIVVDCNEQTSAVASVVSGMDKISEIVMKTSEASQSGAAASEELSSQAQMMRVLVGKFQLRE